MKYYSYKNKWERIVKGQFALFKSNKNGFLPT